MTGEILVFGKTGQLAVELAQRLPQARFLSRADVDVSDTDAVKAAIADMSPRAVINATAYTNVDEAETNGDLAHAINAAGPGAMAQGCKMLGIPFLHVSTDYVFDGTGETPWREDMATDPINAYGASKLAGEAAIVAAGGSYVILRTAWVFAAHGQNFVKTMLRLSESHPELTVVHDQFGAPTWAGDIAQVLIDIAPQLRENSSKSGIYHYSGQPYVTWADFTRAIFAEAGLENAVKNVTSEAFVRPAARPQNSRLNCEKIADVFGVKAPDWHIGLRNVLNDLKVG